MNVEALFLFLILLLSLVLCSFLGGNCNKEKFSMNQNSISQRAGNRREYISSNNTNESNNSSYDNYNHFNGSSSELENGSTFTGSNGGTVIVTTNSDGTQSLQVTLQNGETPVTFTTNPSSSFEGFTGLNGTGSVTKFYGPNGSTAIVININGRKAIQIRTSTTTYTFTESGSLISNNLNSDTYYGSTGTPINESNYAYNTQVYYGPNGGKIKINVNGVNTVTLVDLDGNTTIFRGIPDVNGSIIKYNGPNGGTATIVILNNGEKAIKVMDAYGNSIIFTTNQNNEYSGSAGSVTGPQGNSAYYATGPNGNTVVGTTNETGYYDGNAGLVEEPRGNNIREIRASQIPTGDEDLYILKSQIVPPVCPACPSSASCPRQEKCPPCPACARCPEPSFECKKVPNYNAIDNDYLPIPVLNDFSSFGM